MIFMFTDILTCWILKRIKFFMGGIGECSVCMQRYHRGMANIGFPVLQNNSNDDLTFLVNGLCEGCFHITTR